MPTPAPTPQKTGIEVEHADPWKEDGNIIFSAGGKYFRVHRSVLSAYSEVFKDMFESPHAGEAETEYIELCPVVQLHDAETDVQVMLRAMYDRSYPSLSYEKTPLSTISAFLHLGEKYDIPTLVKEAKRKLCCTYPLTSMDIAGCMTRATKLFPAIGACDPHNFRVMNLLEEMGLKAPLPMAMYQCITTCPLRNIIEGYTFGGSFHTLSPTNLRSFMWVKDILERYRVALAKNLSTSPGCRSNCVNDLHRLWSEDINVLPPLDEWKVQWDKVFCGPCVTTLRGRRKVEMEKAWNEIPTAFGFRTWEQVKQSGDFPSFTLRAS